MPRSRQDIEEGIQHYLDRHGTFREEAYQFNIKMHRIGVPDSVREQLAEIIVNGVIVGTMRRYLETFAADMKATYDWIGDWAQAGRMGGWLVFEARDAVLDRGELHPEDLPEARKRLRNLETIDRLVRYGKRELLETFESQEFWRETVPEYRPPSRKDWDPREQDNDR